MRDGRREGTTPLTAANLADRIAGRSAQPPQAECTCVDDEDVAGNRFRDWDEDCPIHGISAGSECLSGSAQPGAAAAAGAESTAALSTRADGLAADLRWTVKHLRREPMPLADLIPLLQDAANLLELVTQIGETIEQWAQAYPADVFPEPDFKRAREVLEAGGVSLDCVSASNMRHVVTRVHELFNRGPR